MRTASPTSKRGLRGGRSLGGGALASAAGTLAACSLRGSGRGACNDGRRLQFIVGNEVACAAISLSKRLEPDLVIGEPRIRRQRLATRRGCMSMFHKPVAPIASVTASTRGSQRRESARLRAR
jgi:hypothetical protein